MSPKLPTHVGAYRTVLFASEPIGVSVTAMLATWGRPTTRNFSAGMCTPLAAYRSMPAWPATKIWSNMAVTGLKLFAFSLSPCSSCTWVSSAKRTMCAFSMPLFT